MQKRKDSKGRALKDGESQRKDGLYQYRWSVRGKRYSTDHGACQHQYHIKHLCKRK